MFVCDCVFCVNSLLAFCLSLRVRGISVSLCMCILHPYAIFVKDFSRIAAPGGNINQPVIIFHC